DKLPMLIRAIDVEGFGVLSIRYVYQRSEAVDAIHLLFLHDSFLESRKLLPLLTANHPRIHVVAISLPG
ncbi:hypothetical protein DICSQDRAFT_61639, partial [Dichomitus squalens LYAD-421 SS1]